MLVVVCGWMQSVLVCMREIICLVNHVNTSTKSFSAIFHALFVSDVASKLAAGITLPVQTGDLMPYNDDAAGVSLCI